MTGNAIRLRNGSVDDDVVGVHVHVHAAGRCPAPGAPQEGEAGLPSSRLGGVGARGGKEAGGDLLLRWVFVFLGARWGAPFLFGPNRKAAPRRRFAFGVSLALLGFGLGFGIFEFVNELP